jgi:hypothetical protein
MAKAKKSESTARTTKAAPKKAATKSSAPTGTPLIDTSLVAQTAAAMIGNRAVIGSGPSSGKAESSTFKNLKESLNKPGGSALNSILHSTTNPGAKKSNQPFGGNKQSGHSQTFGADVNRTNVPRRTAG